MIRALGEIEAAHIGGYTRWKDFVRARRLGLFPKPDLTQPDRWTETTLRRWLDPSLDDRRLDREQRQLLEKFSARAVSGP